MGKVNGNARQTERLGRILLDLTPSTKNYNESTKEEKVSTLLYRAFEEQTGTTYDRKVFEEPREVRLQKEIGNALIGKQRPVGKWETLNKEQKVTRLLIKAYEELTGKPYNPMDVFRLGNDFLKKIYTKTKLFQFTNYLLLYENSKRIKSWNNQVRKQRGNRSPKGNSF